MEIWDTFDIARTEVQNNLGHDGYPLNVMALSQGKGKTKMLVLQETPFAPQSHQTKSECVDCLIQSKTEREVLDILKDFGYKVATVDYDNKQGLTPEEQGKISRFVFKLKKLEVEE